MKTSLQKNPESPQKPQEIPDNGNVPKQPEICPPGDKPISPTDPGNQPID